MSKIRNWIRLVEQTQWPSHVSPHQLIDLISWGGVGRGEIPYEVVKFTEYDLQTVPIAQMKANWKLRNPKNVEAFAQRMREGEIPPPVIYDAVSEVLIDGAHRLAAAELAGLKTLPAYVGTVDHLDPEWEDIS